MKCPMCGARTTQVLDSRQTDHGAAVRRRRCCPKCDVRFTTYERIEQLVPVTVDNGRSELLARRGAFGLTTLRPQSGHDAQAAR
jgi:transcriptional regulator NrdR family protein